MTRDMRSRIVALGVGLAALMALAAMPLVGSAQGDVSHGDLVPTWEIAYGGYEQLDDIAAASSKESWGIDIAVVPGGGGPTPETLFVHRDGDLWRVAQVALGTQMNAIDMVSPTEGFAVGERGDIYRYRGFSWTPVRSPTAQRLVDIDLVSAELGWAVGDRGTILRWDGRSWEPTEVPSQVRVFQISSVAAPSPAEAWATSLGGEILRFEGDAWEIVDAPPIAAPAAIAFRGSGYGMAVGRTALVYESGAWREILTPPATLTSLAWDGDIAYAVGATTLWQYEDETWSPFGFDGGSSGLGALRYGKVAADAAGVWGFDVSGGATIHIADQAARYVRPDIQELVALDMMTTTVGWSGGRAVTHGLIGADDGRWTQSHAMSQGSIVRDIALASVTDGWAVGDSGGEDPRTRMWRWDGAAWTDWPVSSTWQLSHIDMLAEDDGWANGGNLIARWDGKEWREVVDVPPAAAPGGLSMLRGAEDPEGWFGGYGEIYHLADGQWTRHVIDDTNLVTDISVPEPNEGWASTGTTLLRFDGETWSVFELGLPAGSLVYDVEAVAQGNAWFLIEDAGLVHWDGESWVRHPLAPLGGHFEPLRLSVLPLERDTFATEIWMAGEKPSVGVYRTVSPVGVIHMPVAARGGVLRP